MPEANGVTRREFDRLDAKVSRIDEGGSVRMRVVEERIGNMHKDISELRFRVDALTRAFWTLVVVIFTGTISLIVALGSGALGGG